MKYYIASCVFTSRFPQLSFRILDYIRKKGELEIVRCCVMHYRENDFINMMPDDLKEAWAGYPSSAEFQPGDIVYSLCHNCTAILDEWKPGVITKSLWEYIAEDESFSFKDFHHEPMYIQDCWRAYDKAAEQDAVRQLMSRMNIQILEMDENHEKTQFCGNSLYRPAPPRNPKLAPKRFGTDAKGKFENHTLEEQKAIMEDYVNRYKDHKIISYCHYCHEGLILGGADAYHIASLLFGEEPAL